ncbi:hypothetical protein OFB78_29205, partial [Escherichia coli]|nr:hypothetical protein [Escherichia coli]
MLTDVNWGRSEGCVFPGEALEDGRGKGKEKYWRHSVVEKRQGNSEEDGGTHGGDGEGKADEEDWGGEGEVGEGEG